MNRALSFFTHPELVEGSVPPISNVPEGRLKVARYFNAGFVLKTVLRPIGTFERPALNFTRPYGTRSFANPVPGTEVPGSFQRFLPNRPTLRALVFPLLILAPALASAQVTTPADPAPVISPATNAAAQVAPSPGPVVMPPLATPAPGSSIPRQPTPLPSSAPPDNSALSAPAPMPAMPPNAAPPVLSLPPDATPAMPGRSAPVNDEPLADVRPPVMSSNFWTYFVLAVLALIVVGLLLWLALQRRRPPISAKTAYELTLERLERARALLQEDNPVPYAVSISEAVRAYLGLRFAAPSTRRTTEEFLRQMEADRNTPLAEHRELLRDFLQSCDLVKFARYQPRLEELEHVQERAYNFVTATKPVETVQGSRA